MLQHGKHSVFFPEGLFFFGKNLAAYLFDKGIMSSGQAAHLAGITKREFLENVDKYGVSVFGESVDDIENIING